MPGSVTAQFHGGQVGIRANAANRAQRCRKISRLGGRAECCLPRPVDVVGDTIADLYRVRLKTAPETATLTLAKSETRAEMRGASS